MTLSVVFDARSVNSHYPGIGRYGSGLTQAMAERKDVRLTLLVNADEADTFYELPDVRRVPVRAKPVDVAQQWLVPLAVHRLGADVYHSPYYLMPYWPFCPTVVTLHDLIPLCIPEGFARSAKLIYWWTQRLAARAARRIIAVSRATAHDLVDWGLPREKIVVVPEGVGPEFYPRSQDEQMAIRARYGLPERFVLFVGTNKPHKNLGMLIRAWAGLEAPWPLVVAGSTDPRYPSAQELGAKYGVQVLALGPIRNEDLPVLYSAATIFVFPSLYEGFGLPVIEAMACGTPVLCSNVSSLPEVAADAALTFDPYRLDAIRDALQRAVTTADLRRELSERGRARVAEFTWQRAAERTVRVYHELLEEERL